MNGSRLGWLAGLLFCTQLPVAQAGFFEAFARGGKAAQNNGEVAGAPRFDAGHGQSARGVAEDYLTTYIPTWVTFGPPGFLPPIPPGFFDPGSDPFFGQIPLEGVPLSPPVLGATDVVIRRFGDPVLPLDPPGASGTVPIELVQLHLTSVNPIVVTYGGTATETWDVVVRPSPSVPPPAGGFVSAQKTHPNGGLFNSLVLIQPIFIFTRLSDSQVRIIDTALPPFQSPPLQLRGLDDPFVHLPNPSLELITQPGAQWIPGVEEVVPGDPASQQVVQFDELTNDGGNTVRHTICTTQKRACLYQIVCKNSLVKGGCDNCGFTCGNLCRGPDCVDTCPGDYGNLCGGPNCCLGFDLIGCQVPPAGIPLCPAGQPCTCAPHGGACCDSTGNCLMVADECECDAIAGRYVPGATTCGGFGACCFDDNTCQEMAETCCLNRGGVFIGDGVACGGGLQACCQGDGSCVMADPACCFFLMMGTPQGAGSACSTFAAPCCLPSGTCDLVDPICCDDLGGTLLPLGATCDGTTQACCLPSGVCQDMDRDCCLQDGGTPQGVGSGCATTICQPGACVPLPNGSGCNQDGCSCFGECINGGYCDDPACCLDPNDCLCYERHTQESIKLCGDCFGECIGGSYCDDPADPTCWINPGGAACYVPSHPVSVYLCKDCFGQCINGSYCDHPNPDCCLGGPGNCQCYSPTDPISLKMCPNVDRCEPRCVDYDPLTGQSIVTQCDCVGWHGCHVNLPGGTDGLRVAQRGSGNPCVVNDPGPTVTLPPAGCAYLSPDDVHAIIDGLPAGTTIELAAIHKDFICHVPGEQNPVCSFQTLVDCDEPGGSLGGEKECAESTLDMQLTGTGALAGFNRTVTVPIGFETHTAPRTPGDLVQSFDTDMFRLFGQISNPGSGDPDFDLLRVTAGTDFGMPSPGHTTLTQLPGGNWAVDSFFDITYRIDFVGRPGGPLGGMSGSTTATIRMSTGSGLSCVGQCPPGQNCIETKTTNADGTIRTCCDCEGPPPVDEACCVQNAVGYVCFMALATECTAQGGTPQGAGSVCLGMEACCLPSGACINADRVCCDDAGGVPQGAGSVCLGDNDGNGIDDVCQPPPCEPVDDGSACTQSGCSCFGECINGSYCDDPNCCLDPANCLCYARNAQESIKLCGDCFGECIGGSYCDGLDPSCWINPGGPACYVPNHPVSVYLCKDCFGQCIGGSYCDGPNPDCCLGGPGNCQCYAPGSPISLKMCPEVDRCEAHCAKFNPFTGQTTVTDCDCVGWHGCHVNLPGGADGRSTAGRGTGNPCVVNDPGPTVTLPPAGCAYLSPDEVHAIIDGLPPGTTIELAAIHRDFICNEQGTINPVCSFQTLVDCDEPGGSLGGEKECAESTLDMQLTGTGALAGFNRTVTVPIGFETHTAPRTPGDPVQSFDTDMFRLFGQISNPGSGDPDFDLLRVTAGTDFGLPSPGHTTLTQLPGGNWAVDSFFDITYRIDFVGRPGGPLGGMSGSTTATIRMSTGGGLSCVGQCPPGTVCRDTRVVNADGTIDLCCDCQNVPLDQGCCLDDGLGGTACVNALPGDCVAMGGIPQGPGNLCSTPQPCCMSDGRCRMVDPLCCDEAGGSTCCAGSQCRLYGDVFPKPDGDGIIDVDDILKVLDAFVDPAAYPNGDIISADFSCVPDGIIDVTDILAELDAFQGIYACSDSPCP